MTYLPKTSGSEEDNTEQAEELEVRSYKIFGSIFGEKKISHFLLYYTLKKKITLFNAVNVCNKNDLHGHLFILPIKHFFLLRTFL